MNNKLFILFFSFLFGFYVVAQTTPPNYIKTIQLKPLGEKIFRAAVRLGTVLELSFDDLKADSKDYQYKIQQMTFNWKPSTLSTNQYINGFNQNTILNVNNSFNTLQSYTHYSVQIPNQNTSITKSGNYLISVLNDDDKVVFSRRFILYEDIVTVGVSVYRSRNTKTIDEQQTVQFSINYPTLTINNPTQEIKVALLQNNNWQTSITNLQPQFFKQHQLLYNYVKKTNFWGGNEFLNFDTKSLRSTNLKIEKTELKNIFYTYLYNDENRTKKPYTYNPDINGQFVIRTLEGNNPQTEADYSKVFFSLIAPQPYKNKKVYVYGAFNNFQFTSKNLMFYNKEQQQYKTTIKLKQGFYNYSYVTKNESGRINRNEINGTFYQTENQYTVLVYYKPFGGLYDRVIGVGKGSLASLK